MCRRLVLICAAVGPVSCLEEAQFVQLLVLGEAAGSSWSPGALSLCLEAAAGSDVPGLILWDPTLRQGLEAHRK